MATIGFFLYIFMSFELLAVHTSLRVTGIFLHDRVQQNTRLHQQNATRNDLLSLQCFDFRFDESETDFLRFAPSNSKHFKALRFQHEPAGRKCASISRLSSIIIKQVCGCTTDLQRLPPGPATCRF